jgi:hypothetical protein
LNVIAWSALQVDGDAFVQHGDIEDRDGLNPDACGVDGWEYAFGWSAGGYHGRSPMAAAFRVFQELPMVDQQMSLDKDLLQIRSEAEQLRGLVIMLADEPAGVRDVWHWQWDDLMGRFQRLCQLRQQGLMPAGLEGEFQTVSRLLADSRKLVEALGCEVPPEIDNPSLVDVPPAR